MYLVVKLCRHVAVNFPWTSQRDQNSFIYLNVRNLVPNPRLCTTHAVDISNNLNTPPTRAQVAVMYLVVKSCRHVAVNFPWTSQRDQNSCIYPNVCNPVPNSRLSATHGVNISNNLNTPPTSARVAVMYLFVKSCRHVAINFPWTSQRDQNSCIYPNVCNLVPNSRLCTTHAVDISNNLNTPPTRARLEVTYLLSVQCYV